MSGFQSDAASRLLANDPAQRLIESSPAMKFLSEWNRTQAMLSPHSFEIAAANSLASTLADQFQGASYLDWQGAVSGLMEMASACRTMLDEIPFDEHRAMLSGLYDSLRLIQDRSPYMMASEQTVDLNGEPFGKAAEAIEASLPFLPEDVRESVKDVTPLPTEADGKAITKQSILKMIKFLVTIATLLVTCLQANQNEEIIKQNEVQIKQNEVIIEQNAVLIQQNAEQSEQTQGLMLVISSVGDAIQELTDQLEGMDDMPMELNNLVDVANDAVDAFEDLDVPDRQAGDQEQEQ